MAEKNEQSVREFAIQSLANDFLDVSDGNLDFRAYLVETTLPTVIIAMEKLLENVEKRNDIINSMTEVSSSSSPGSNSLSSSKSSFDPLNWLAQYLYRNNPRYTNFTDSNSAQYVKSMHDVGMALKTRLFEMETNKRAKRRADEMSRRQKEAHEDMAKAAQTHDRANVFDNNLSSLFMKWSANLLRQSTLFVTMKELVNEIDDVYELISASNKVLGQKIASLRKSLIDEHNLENDGSSQSGKQTYWGLTTFVDEMSKLMESWTVDDLSEFSTVWNGCTEQGLSVLQQKFDAMFFVPSLYIDEVDGGDINTRSKAALLSLCNAVEMDTATGFESRSLRDAFFNFCSKSTEDEEVSFEDEFMAFSKSLVGEFGLERVEAIFAQLKPQELVTHTEDELDLISMLDAIEKNPSVEISIRKFNASIDNVLSRGDLDHDMKRILHLLKVHAPARIILSKKMSRTALIAHVHNISKGIELPVFHALINIFVQRNSNSTGDDKPASANEKAVIVEEEEEEEEEKEKRDHVEDIV